MADEETPVSYHSSRSGSLWMQQERGAVAMEKVNFQVK